MLSVSKGVGAVSDNVEKLRRANDELLIAGNDYSDTLLDSAIEIERLRELLSEIWRHRNGGSALSTCWDRRVTEVLDGNGPA